jgi:hypothetical protein
MRGLHPLAWVPPSKAENRSVRVPNVCRSIDERERSYAAWISDICTQVTLSPRAKDGHLELLYDHRTERWICATGATSSRSRTSATMLGESCL